MARIEVEINGARLVADSTAGPGTCRECAMPRRGKACVWSMVCANVLNGANFKGRPTPGSPTPTLPREGEGKNEREAQAERMAEYYQKDGYKGD